MNPVDRLSFNRRRFLEYFSSIGLGATLLPGALLAQAQDAPTITLGMVDEAARVAGLSLSPEAEKKIAEALSRKNGLLANYQGPGRDEAGQRHPAGDRLQSPPARDGETQSPGRLPLSAVPSR